MASRKTLALAVRITEAADEQVYCAPSAVSLITGIGTAEALSLLRSENGLHSGVVAFDEDEISVAVSAAGGFRTERKRRPDGPVPMKSLWELMEDGSLEDGSLHLITVRTGTFVGGDIMGHVFIYHRGRIYDNGFWGSPDGACWREFPELETRIMRHDVYRSPQESVVKKTQHYSGFASSAA